MRRWTLDCSIEPVKKESQSSLMKDSAYTVTLTGQAIRQTKGVLFGGSVDWRSKILCGDTDSEDSFTSKGSTP